jgi:hypothetical protein
VAASAHSVRITFFARAPTSHLRSTGVTSAGAHLPGARCVLRTQAPAYLSAARIELNLMNPLIKLNKKIFYRYEEFDQIILVFYVTKEFSL